MQHARVTDGNPLEIGQVYARAVDLARQARSWFDGPGLAWRATLPVTDQATVATENLLTTARLMAIIAWAVDPGHDKSLGALLPRFLSAAFVDGGNLPRNSPLAGTPGGEIALASRHLVDAIAQSPPIAQKPPSRSDGLWRS